MIRRFSVFSGLVLVYRQWRDLLVDVWVRYTTIGACILTIVSLIAIAWKWQKLPPLVPLWYSRAWGTDQLAQTIYLFILPAATIMWYLVTTFTALFLAREYPVFLHVLYLTSLFVAIMSTVTLINILLIIS